MCDPNPEVRERAREIMAVQRMFDFCLGELRAGKANVEVEKRVRFGSWVYVSFSCHWLF